MLFNSPVYIFIFLPLVVIIYFILNKMRFTIAGKVWLVLASLFFYGYWDEKYLILIMASIAVNYGVGRALRFEQQTEARRSARILGRRTILILGVVFNLGLLGYYKYSNFFIENIRWIIDVDIPFFKLVLPLAISFFTFQQIAFLVDCYKKKAKEYSFINYCLFVTFFPQLIMGPIVHHSEMMPQFVRKRNCILQLKNISLGLFIFSMGLFKKVFIADTFAIWANAGFDSGAQLNFFEAWGTSLSFMFQLYYDFSAYSDMAIGAALMLNIRLPENFNSPYQAANITEFWKRWHMTLIRWVRDYVYVPLRQFNRSEPNAHLSLLITLVLVGMWHGAGWLFIMFGGLHGLALSAHRIWRKLGYRMSRLLGTVLTFLFCTFSVVLFRSREFGDVKRIFEGMVSFDKIKITEGFSKAFNYLGYDFLPELVGQSGEFIVPIECAEYLLVFGMMAFLFKNSIQIAKGIVSFRFYHVVFVAFALIMVIFYNIQNTPSEFYYFQF